jgi:glycine betaine/proline transport system substrate-binding protein
MEDLMRRKVSRLFVFVTLSVLLSIATAAADKTNKVKIAKVGWTGVTIKTEIAEFTLSNLGYKVDTVTMSVPIVYAALSTGDADFFLGNWMPSMANIADKYFENGTVIQYCKNMPGAKYTLAVPSYCTDMGLKDFSDIAKFGEELDWKIYGIEAGNDGNKVIHKMIDNDMFGLGKFKLVPSSEMAMLAQVQSYAKEKKPIVFLGWAPHSMNERIDMTYLTGSTAETFGANDGSATIWTNTRVGLEKDMPNVALYLRNLDFPVSMINQIMTQLHEDNTLSPKDAGLNWVSNHPEKYKEWLKGVKTFDGTPAIDAFEPALKKAVQ